MITCVESAACLGLNAYSVKIEVDVSHGLPQFIVVGLPDASVKESRERVRAAIKNTGFRFPVEKITINLAPADIKKEGAAFDLPMALGILAANGIISPESLKNHVFLGELALDGSIRPFKGALCVASGLKGKRTFVFPYGNALEAKLEKEACVLGVQTLKQVVAWLRGEEALEPLNDSLPIAGPAGEAHVDYAEVKGQLYARRAIEIAVAGNHNLLFIGAPGSGKSMLSRRIPTILPPLESDEMLEITKIYSVAGGHQPPRLMQERPFRAPHHSISPAALIGGGPWPKPGEISLAHHGVLFLDEFPEFHRDVLESLRGPLEDGEVTVSRAKMQLTFPARFLMVCAMNPCPCGYLGDRKRACRCSSVQIARYKAKISGPILDRIDLHVEVASLEIQSLSSDAPGESSEKIRTRVLMTRECQSRRFAQRALRVNGLMRAKDLREHCRLDGAGEKLLQKAVQELRLSARAYYKILKVSRTVADLAGAERIQAEHVAEAVQYRFLDRQW